MELQVRVEPKYRFIKTSQHKDNTIWCCMYFGKQAKVMLKQGILLTTVYPRYT